MTRELDDRQDALYRIDTLESRPPATIAPSSPANRDRKRSRWDRLVLRLKALVLRPGRRP